MEIITNLSNMQIEAASQQKKNHLQSIKKCLKSVLKSINKKISAKKSSIVEESRSTNDENKFNEILERRMEDQQNLINEQISGQQLSSYCFVENEHGKFYWSSDVNQFVAVDRDLIQPKFCISSFQRAQIQSC